MKPTMKAVLFAAGLLFMHAAAFSQQVAKTISSSNAPEGHIGFLEFRPSDYGSQKHPLIIFLHGIGERGNGTSDLNSVATWAIPLYCANGASMRFTVNGQTSSFVVLSPQLSSQFGYWPPFYVKEILKYAKQNLNIDTNRIYLTGLSLGGGGVWRAITDTYGFDHTFDAGIAAAAPVCGTQEMNDADYCSTIGANHLPIWAFHAMDDGVVGVGATQHGEILSSICGVTPASKFTYYQSGNHWGAWFNAYDTGHITTTLADGSNFTANPNLYEWFLSKTRATTVAAPVAVAGPPQTITATSTVLNAAASYSPNGSITSYNWQQINGPAAVIANAASATPTISNMVLGGSYEFKLTVTDIAGASSSAMTNVTVMAALPVELTYFTGAKNSTGNLLQWATATEQNNDYFAVERSEDGAVFAAIAKVAGAGTSNGRKEYAYSDLKAPAGNAYYRLRQVDKDGRFTISKVVTIATNSRITAEQMFPNPVQNNLAVVISNDVKGNGNIAVYDATGRVVTQQAVVKNEKLLNAAVNMNSIAPGIYMVEVKIGDSYRISKSIVKK